MTLIHDEPTAHPGVHVLVIGAGAYPHIEGVGLGLGPLTTPFRSAIAFARWLQASLRHPEARLSSIDVLASHPRWPEGGTKLPETPTAANIEAAFARWYRRCDASPDHVGIMFFCGHGVEIESQLIFPDDLGRNHLRPLDDSIDITETFQAMRSCTARSQYFFIDACREMPFEVILNRSVKGAPLCDLKWTKDRRNNSALLFSTASGASASGKPDKPSVFTDALIRALDGAGGRILNERWVIEYGSLHTALCELLAASSPHGSPQVSQSQGTGRGVIHVLADAPVVPVSVRCTPQARAVRLEHAVNSSQYMPEANANPWHFSVPADEYWVDIDWAIGDRVVARKRFTAVPPSTNVERMLS